MAKIQPYTITLTHGVIYLAQPGTAYPTPALPYGGMWPDGWESPGGTEGGISVKLENTLKEKLDDRAMAEVGFEIVNQKLTVSTKLNSFTLKNLQLVWGGRYLDVDPTTTVPGYELLEGGGSSATQDYLWGIEAGWNDRGTRRPARICFKGMALNGSELMLKRDEQIGIALEIKGLFDLEQPEGKQLFRMWRNTKDVLS